MWSATQPVGQWYKHIAVVVYSSGSGGISHLAMSDSL